MKGVLLVNLGTPAAPTPQAVGAYLREFLADPRVVDLPRWLWLPVLHLAIVPLRRQRSAAAYRKIWRDGGSPLLVHSRSLADRLAAALEGHATIALAMRYGEPSVQNGLAALRSAGVEQLVVLPLYPQYSRTTTESVFDAVAAGLRTLNWFPEVVSVREYHDHPGWMDAIAGSIRAFQSRSGKPDKLVFSMHGIPERYAAAGDPYPRQCRASIDGIVERLGCAAADWVLTYQSRVGREPWLQPYTDQTLTALARDGAGVVQVVCPGFAVDCLETLEEIEMQNGELFRSEGGDRLEYIPALNDSGAHVGVLSEIIGSA